MTFEYDSHDFFKVVDDGIEHYHASASQLLSQSHDVLSRLDDHERRLDVLESAPASSRIVIPSTSTTRLVVAPPVTVDDRSAAGAACMLGCGNATGLGRKAAPNDIRKHIQSVAHVEAALCLLPVSLHGTAQRLCRCDSQLPPLIVALAVVLKKVVKSDTFANLEGQFCQNRACLALKFVTPALSAAITVAQDQIALTYDSYGSRKRLAKSISRECDQADAGDSSTLHGDQTVAVAFGVEKFSTPGAVYVVFDAANNQLLVQMKRPSVSTYHVAHVARMHRWMRHVLHFAPQQHKLWDSHVAVADSGFIDAFVIAALSDVGDIDCATDRERLHTRIASGELVLCAGRSDGWLELVAAKAALAEQPDRQRIALPLAHLQPHSFRRFDAQAQPSLPLLSERHGAPLSRFDVRMQHYAPCQVTPGSAMVKLEMLCKCSGWHLVAPAAPALPSVDIATKVEEQRERGRDVLSALIEMAELEELSQHQREAMSARQRAIDAIEQAEQLRLQNIALSQRLADAERAAREGNKVDNGALLARVAQLERRLAQARQRELDAKNAPTPPTATVAATPPTLPQVAAATLFSQDATPTAATVESEMRASGKRVALYYRRGDRKDLRLCVRLAQSGGGDFVHSKISQNDDGSFSCVREVSAQSLDELLSRELQLKL